MELWSLYLHVLCSVGMYMWLCHSSLQLSDSLQCAMCHQNLKPWKEHLQLIDQQDLIKAIPCACAHCVDLHSYACVRVALTSDQSVGTHIQSWGASTPHQIETFIVRLEGSWGGLLWVPALGNVVHEFDEWQCSRHTPACTPLHTEQLAGSMSLVNLPSTCRSRWLKDLRIVTFLSRWQLIPPLPYGYLVGLLISSKCSSMKMFTGFWPSSGAKE